MLYKISNKITNIFNRDFAYKSQVKNVHKIVRFKKFVATQKISSSSAYLGSVSSFIFLFDSMPYLLKLKKPQNVRTPQALTQIKQNLSFFNFFNFIERAKSDIGIDFGSINNEDTKFICFSAKSSLFDEFLELYEYFSELPDIFISCSIVNCNNKEEKKLLVSGFLNINI